MLCYRYYNLLRYIANLLLGNINDRFKAIQNDISPGS